MEIPEVTSIQRVEIKDGDLLVVRIARGSMPPTKFGQFAQEISNKIKDIFPNNKIWVMDKDTEISVIASENAQK